MGIRDKFRREALIFFGFWRTGTKGILCTIRREAPFLACGGRILREFLCKIRREGNFLWLWRPDTKETLYKIRREAQFRGIKGNPDFGSLWTIRDSESVWQPAAVRAHGAPTVINKGGLSLAAGDINKGGGIVTPRLEQL